MSATPVNGSLDTADGPGQPGPGGATPGRRWLRGLGLALLALVLVVAAFAGWVLATPSGTSWALRQLPGAVPGLALGASSGTLSRGLVLRDVRWVPPDGGPRVTIREARVRVRLAALFHGAVHVEDAAVDGVRVRLAPGPEEEPKPFTLEPPIAVVVERFVATDVEVHGEDGALLTTIRRADAAGRWTDALLEIREFDLRAREGTVQLAGRVRTEAATGPAGPYDADVQGAFRWQAGGTEWYGTVEATSTGDGATDSAADGAADGDRAGALAAANGAPSPTAGARPLVVVARLITPFAAGLRAELAPEDTLPWRAQLRVPAFDPRAALLPDGSVTSLAAQLDARGTADTAAASGTVTVNGQLLRLDELRGRWAEQVVHLDRLRLGLGDAPGRLTATGRIALGGEQPVATLRAEWDGITIPAELAGQALATRGRLAFDGGPADFRTEGRFAIGPPPRLADVVLRASGDRTRVELQQLDVVQATGRLATRGTLTLSPALAWQLDAQATSFDPGEFLADWRGDLDLALATEGRMAEAGPTGTLDLERLAGTLRGRPIRGQGELEFALPARLAGELTLSSGRSRLAVQGRRGDTLDATATFDVGALDDFVPAARGSLAGRLRARGDWPALAIEGRVNGRDLGTAAASIASLVADVDVRNPREPEGTVSLRATGIEAGEILFDELVARLEGEPDAHRLALDARGEPFDARVRVRGALDGTAWNGTVGELALRVAEAANLRLRAPVRVAWDDGALDVSRACLDDGALALCVEGERGADGALAGAYELRDVPLALAGSFAPDAIPGELRGSLGGEGRVRRDAEGRWFGSASLASASASIRWDEDAPGAVVGEELLLYRDLAVDATLRGDALDARLAAATTGDGRVRGSFALEGLGRAAPGVRGELDASLPTLAPFAPFVPQLDALQGRVVARATVAGTLAEPRFRADARADGLAAELPLLGLELRAGELRLVSRDDGAMSLSGGITSGDGRLTLAGTVLPDGRVDATIEGERVLAADLPAARVIATPRLELERTAEELRLTGRVAIPEATVNLQRLPALVPRASRASPDVVIVNEPERQAEAAAGLPLVARVQVVLGDDVDLAGFGLEARVAGQLTVVERPGRETVGTGEIRIEGGYRAFGQDLTITGGRALFAGTPLDDPRLDVTAVREIEEDDVRAGLRIRGTGRDPQVSVFSDPSLGETEALAYLVTGRPMSRIGGAGGGQDPLLTNAAESLGAAAGGLLARRLGQRLGFDEVGVDDDEDIGGAAFTVGQYLSPRLYLGYGVGLFEPGQVVTIRYSLSEAVTIEAVRAEAGTRAGVEYRIER